MQQQYHPGRQLIVSKKQPLNQRRPWVYIQGRRYDSSNSPDNILVNGFS